MLLRVVEEADDELTAIVETHVPEVTDGLVKRQLGRYERRLALQTLSTPTKHAEQCRSILHLSRFYCCAMHYSAKRGLAITRRLSVRL